MSNDKAKEEIEKILLDLTNKLKEAEKKSYEKEVRKILREIDKALDAFNTVKSK